MAHHTSLSWHSISRKGILREYNYRKMYLIEFKLCVVAVNGNCVVVTYQIFKILVQLHFRDYVY